MKIRYYALLALAMLGLAFVGCETVTNAVYEEVKTPTGEIQTGAGVKVSDLPVDIKAACLAQGYDEADVVFLDELDAAAVAKIQAEAPETIETQYRALYTTEYKVKPMVDSAIQATGMIPVPGANYIPIALSGALTLLSTWLAKQKSKAQAEVSTQAKAIKTLAIVDDTLQDALDQLALTNAEASAKIYDIRQQAIEVVANANGVLTEVNEALAANATPTKTLYLTSTSSDTKAA